MNYQKHLATNKWFILFNVKSSSNSYEILVNVCCRFTANSIPIFDYCFINQFLPTKNQFLSFSTFWKNITLTFTLWITLNIWNYLMTSPNWLRELFGNVSWFLNYIQITWWKCNVISVPSFNTIYRSWHLGKRGCAFHFMEIQFCFYLQHGLNIFK